ncbi:type II toxin-antitoxin system VapC family toxin [Endozoicomonas acroporae]|uniref:type II toxin-antitoxin system VapC family toxin n=1 Tax=Endozoicomonas acroporae TaxID=1701104 RepID=UPI000C76357A|nr:TA system VapC family ribonuclease toxin [Endozoicomonas acroporae]
MKLIDTNILVYASIPFFDEHELARALLEQVASQKARHCITWINIFEYLRVVTHPKLIKPKPLGIEQALANIRNLLDQPAVSRIDPGSDHLLYFAEIIQQVAPVRGNFVHNCRIAAVMKEHSVSEILTRDTDFRKIPGFSVTNPFD